MRNKKAQLGITLMGILFFMLIGFTMINFLFNEIDTARSQLNCSSANDISDGVKILCLIVDLTIPYWIWGIISITMGVLIMRLAL